MWLINRHNTNLIALIIHDRQHINNSSKSDLKLHLHSKKGNQYAVYVDKVQCSINQCELIVECYLLLHFTATFHLLCQIYIRIT
jgi:myo-inositol-hexaphosphate 3-phosphohydrolase